MEYSPEVSIIMPVFNSEKYVQAAIKSLLAQTFRDFELIVVNDGSTDKSLGKIQSFRDNRMRILSNDRNRGIVYSRNRGLKEARGKFIAPFDSDDIALPDKFEKQIRFLKENPDYGMIGAWVILIDELGKPLKKAWKLIAPPERIPSILLFKNYFVQSAMVVRREAIPSGLYTEGFDIGEDYKMWIEIANKYKTWNYPEFLIKYRQHEKSITQREVEKMKEWDLKVFEFAYKILDIALQEDQKKVLLALRYDSQICSLQTMEAAEDFMLQIIDSNQKLNKYSQKELTRVIYNRWLKLFLKSKPKSLNTIMTFLNSPIQRKMLRSLVYSSY